MADPKLYRVTTYLGDEQLGSPLYLGDSENDQIWLKLFTTDTAPTRRVVETFQFVSSEEFSGGRP